MRVLLNLLLLATAATLSACAPPAPDASERPPASASEAVSIGGTFTGMFGSAHTR